jgi:hypothetical protein
MRKFAIAGVAALAIAATTAVYAQHRWNHDHMGQSRMSPEDRAAMADAKIAAVHAGLKLTADQEKLWPPVEGAVREFVKLKLDRANARAARAAAAQGDAPKPAVDPVARLRSRADRMLASATVMKKVADAADPLYKTLDDGQKRRLAMLTHRGRHGGGGGGGGGEGWRNGGGGGGGEGGWRGRFERGMMGGPRNFDGGSERL